MNRPSEEVFEFLSDAENDVKWRSGVLVIKRVSGAGEGAQYSQAVKGPGGRRIAAGVEITEYKPNELIGFPATAGPVRPQGRYSLVTVDGDRTTVTFDLEATLSGLKRMMTPMVQKTVDHEVSEISRLKDVLEAQRS